MKIRGQIPAAWPHIVHRGTSVVLDAVAVSDDIYIRCFAQSVQRSLALAYRGQEEKLPA